MSAPELLVVIDPVARRADGESVRIARDVLAGGASARIALPESPEDFARTLARGGGRRVVVIGDDAALLRAVRVLHGEGGAEGGAPESAPLSAAPLSAAPLSMVPVGAPGAVALARSLGLPTGAVRAARAALDGVAHRLDLLVDEEGGVVLSGLQLPVRAGTPVAPVVRDRGRARFRGAGGARWWPLLRPTAGGGPVAPGAPAAHRVRVEADGVLLSDPEQPVEQVTVRTVGGSAEVTVRPAGSAGGGAEGGTSPVRAKASSVTVTAVGPGAGPNETSGFRYRADSVVRGPVLSRTWTVRAEAWALVLPSGGG
ncbi:diacylglycerol kinase [Streptomyces sp. NPDC050504]|uniref:diacylglycerol kinase n=1 Tax=Streptomyces sp. NPDC050504 TaxID=3365618 RepID=UPI0037B0AB0C